MENQSYLKRKQDLMLKEFDTAFSWYQHIEGQIANWRSLIITLLLGYIGFLFTRKDLTKVMLLPLVVIPIPFVLLEIYRRAHLRFLGDNIKQIENIFNHTDEGEFSKQIEAYVFRDHQLVCDSVYAYLCTWGKYFLRGFVDVEALIWYAFIVTSSICAYFFFVANLK